MKKNNRLMAVVLALLMLLQTFSFAAPTLTSQSSTEKNVSVSQFEDFPNDWSAPAVTAAVENGLLKGTSDTTIEVKKNLTRAEMAAIISRAFGATVPMDIGAVKDVKPENWFYSPVSLAYQMGVFQGVSNDMFLPQDFIRREDMFLSLARVLVIEDGDGSKLSAFADGNSVDTWAVGAMDAMVRDDYLHGYEDNTLRPRNNITRAEVAQVFYNIIDTYISTPGDYTEGNLKGTVLVRAKGVHIHDTTIDGDLIVADGVGNGDFSMTNVHVKGRILFRGGEGTVTFKKVTADGKVVISDPNGIVNFHNYRTDTPFKNNLVEYTAAKFLELPGGAGGPSTGGKLVTVKTDFYFEEIDNDDTVNYPASKNVTSSKEVSRYTKTTAQENTDLGTLVPGTISQEQFEAWRDGFEWDEENYPAEDDEVRIISSTTLTRHYKRKTFAVNFINEEGKTPEVLATEEVKYGGLIKDNVDLVLPDETNKVFAGWSTVKDDHEKIVDLSTFEVTDNTKLYPIFKYKYSFEYYNEKVEGGYTLDDTQSGYEFAGKTVEAPTYTIPEGFELNAEDSTDSLVIAKDAENLAKLYYDRVLHTVEFYNEKSVYLATKYFKHGAKITETPDVPVEVEGMPFMGWSTDTTLANIIDLDVYTVTTGDDSNPIKLYAVYDDVDTFAVTFKVDGSNYGKVQHVAPGGYATVPEDPEKKNFKFLYWYLEGDAEQKEVDVASYQIFENTVFVAKFEEVFATVRFYNPTKTAANQLIKTIDTYHIGETIVEADFPDKRKDRKGYNVDSSNKLYSGVYSEDYQHIIESSWLYQDENGDWKVFKADETPIPESGVLDLWNYFMKASLAVDSEKMPMALILDAYYEEDTRAAVSVKDAIFNGKQQLENIFSMMGVEDKIYAKLEERGLVKAGSREIMNINRKINFVDVLGEDALNKFLDEELEANFNMSNEELLDRYGHILLADKNIVDDLLEIESFKELAYSEFRKTVVESGYEELKLLPAFEQIYPQLFDYVYANYFDMVYTLLTDTEGLTDVQAKEKYTKYLNMYLGNGPTYDKAKKEFVFDQAKDAISKDPTLMATMYDDITSIMLTPANSELRESVYDLLLPTMKADKTLMESLYGSMISSIASDETIKSSIYDIISTDESLLGNTDIMNTLYSSAKTTVLANNNLKKQIFASAKDTVLANDDLKKQIFASAKDAVLANNDLKRQIFASAKDAVLANDDLKKQIFASAKTTVLANNALMGDIYSANVATVYSIIKNDATFASSLEDVIFGSNEAKIAIFDALAPSNLSSLTDHEKIQYVDTNRESFAIEVVLAQPSIEQMICDESSTLGANVKAQVLSDDAIKQRLYDNVDPTALDNTLFGDLYDKVDPTTLDNTLFGDLYDKVDPTTLDNDLFGDLYDKVDPTTLDEGLFGELYDKAQSSLVADTDLMKSILGNTQIKNAIVGTSVIADILAPGGTVDEDLRDIVLGNPELVDTILTTQKDNILKCEASDPTAGFIDDILNNAAIKNYITTNPNVSATILNDDNIKVKLLEDSNFSTIKNSVVGNLALLKALIGSDAIKNAVKGDATIKAEVKNNEDIKKLVLDDKALKEEVFAGDEADKGAIKALLFGDYKDQLKDYLYEYINDDANVDKILNEYGSQIINENPELVEDIKNGYLEQVDAALASLKYDLANKEQFEVHEDSKMILMALETYLNELTFDGFRNEYLTAIPDNLINQLPLDIVKPIYERSRQAYLAQVTTAIEKANKGIYSDQNLVDCGITLQFNPISEVYIPLQEWAMSKYDAMGDKLSGRDNELVDKYMQYYEANPYNHALVKLSNPENYFIGTARDYTEEFSGYSLKEFAELYEMIKAASVLLDDTFLWYCENVAPEDVEMVLDRFEERILHYVNYVVDLAETYAQEGIPGSFQELVNDIMIDDMLKNDIIKVGDKVTDKDVLAYIDKLAANGNANNVYDKLEERLAARLEVILQKFSESKFNKTYTQEDYERGKEILNKIHVDNNAQITTEFIFDDVLKSDYKEFKFKNLVEVILENTRG